MTLDVALLGAGIGQGKMDFIVLDAPVPQGFAVVGQRGIQGGVPEGEIIGGKVNGKIVALLTCP